MTNKQKKGEEIITILEENIISDSVVFNVDSNPRIMNFAVKDFYAIFKQEDLVRFRRAGNEYKVLILKIERKMDTCFIRGLIRSDKVLA